MAKTKTTKLSSTKKKTVTKASSSSNSSKPTRKVGDPLFDADEGVVYFKKSETKNYLEIPFNELINNELPVEINKFNLIKKRTYCNKIDLIIDYNNRLFNDYPRIDKLLMSYLSVKWQIDKKAYKGYYKKDEEGNYVLNNKGTKYFVQPENEFFDDMYNKIFLPSFIKFIKNWVEDNYHLNIDEKNKEKDKKFNPVLQFSDKHCKILQSISIGMKITIPLILHFAAMYNMTNINSYLERGFDYLFHIFSKDIDIHTKLWESVYSRVVVTKNSDKTFWNYVEIEGNSINKVTASLYQKLIVDIIPKYEIDQNLINLNHVFINNNIDYTFRSNIEINYKPLNLAENEDEVSDYDKISINTARIDEGEIVINECSIEKTIARALKVDKIKISEEEMEYYEKSLATNKLQQNMISNFFSSDFGGTDTLYFSNRQQYIMLLIIMKKKLLQNGFTLLPSILTAKIQSINEKSTLNKKFLTKIMESVEYKDLTKQKYYFTEESIANNGNSMVIRLVANILNNKFLYHDFEDQKKDDEEIKIQNMEILSEEVLRFVTFI